MEGEFRGICLILGVMAAVFRTIESVLLIGNMAIYDSQAEASEGIPRQWSDFWRRHPALGANCNFRGASPCTGEHRIHYLTGVTQEDWGSIDGELLTLEAGEYAIVQLDDAALRRDMWTWLLGSWLPTSGRLEKKAPEFEKYAGISETGFPVGPVEIWIPLEPLAAN
jgi:predicted transcriptional regulator YdeE